jgi:hypothetical protein
MQRFVAIEGLRAWLAWTVVAAHISLLSNINDRREVAEDLRKQVATYPSSRDVLVDRLAGKDAAFRQSTGKAEALRAKLVRSEITAPTDIEQDVVFAGAVQALPATLKPKDLDAIRTILLACLDRAQGADTRSGNRRGAIYRAACRLDELLYSKKN